MFCLDVSNQTAGKETCESKPQRKRDVPTGRTQQQTARFTPGANKMLLQCNTMLSTACMILIPCYCWQRGSVTRQFDYSGVMLEHEDLKRKRRYNYCSLQNITIFFKGILPFN